MEFEENFDESEGVEVEADESKTIDIEALVKKARRSRQIEETDVQAILASADEEQADKLYEQLQRLGIRLVSETGKTIEDLGDSGNLLEIGVVDAGTDAETSAYATDAEDDPVLMEERQRIESEEAQTAELQRRARQHLLETGQDPNDYVAMSDAVSLMCVIHPELVPERYRPSENDEKEAA